jgi:hypothetical protein
MQSSRAPNSGLSWDILNGVFVISSVPPEKFRGITSDYLTAAFFHIPAYSLSQYHLTIRVYITSAIGSIVMKPLPILIRRCVTLEAEFVLLNN